VTVWSTTSASELLILQRRKVLGFSCSGFGLAGKSSSTQYEYVTGLKSMVGYCFRLIDIAAQMMVFQGSHQAKADTRLDGSHTWYIIDLQRRRLQTLAKRESKGRGRCLDELTSG
jgi:hypothetical protein